MGNALIFVYHLQCVDLRGDGGPKAWSADRSVVSVQARGVAVGKSAAYGSGGDVEPIIVIVDPDRICVSAERSIGRWRQGSSIGVSEVDFSICPGIHTETTLVHQAVMSSA